VVTRREPVIEFATGEMLHRLQYQVLFDNDQFFHAWIDRWMSAPNGVARTFIGAETTLALWDGYHLLQADCKLLHYSISSASDNPAEPVTVRLYYDYGGPNQTLIATATDQTTSGTYSLSAFSPGLYRVYAVMTRTDGNNNGTAVCHAPFTTYTGALSYTTPPTVTDGATPTAADFNKWRANDAMFESRMSPNVPFNGVQRGHVGDELSLVIWSGYVYHDEDHRRLRYKAQLNNVLDGNQLKCIYDYDTVVSKQTLVTISDANEHESYADIPGGVYTPGATYRVVWQMTRATHNYLTTKVTLDYTILAPVAPHSGFTIPGTLQVGQYVYGDTAGQNTRAQLLSLNDADLNSRVGMLRMDYAVRKANYIDLGDSGGVWRPWFFRQQDLLYYRTTGAALHYGNDQTVSLEDYDSSHPYYILDLRSVSGLLPGAGYYLEGESVEFALEL